MIRILQVITSIDIGGAEKLVTDMSPIMQQEGLHVDVLLFKGTDSVFKQRLLNAGVKVYSLSDNGSVYNPLFIYKLLSYLPKYDIIHTHNTACQFYVAFANMLINKNRRPLLITTEHSTTNRRRNIFLLKNIDKWMYNQYNRIVAISDKACQNLQSYLNYEYGQIDTIYNGIDLQAFSSHSYAKKEETNQINLIMVAGFREAKDQKTVIKTIKLLPDNYHLFLVGDGVFRKDCEKLCEDLQLQSRIHFLGKRGDIPALLQQSDIVIMSSFYEGLSLSSIEGMASGRPFIASDVDGLHEITEGAGVLFPQGNLQVLAEKIQKLATDSNYRDKIVASCLRRSAKYDIRFTVRNYIQIYKEMLRA